MLMMFAMWGCEIALVSGRKKTIMYLISLTIMFGFSIFTYVRSRRLSDSIKDNLNEYWGTFSSNTRSMIQDFVSFKTQILAIVSNLYRDTVAVYMVQLIIRLCLVRRAQEKDAIKRLLICRRQFQKLQQASSVAVFSHTYLLQVSLPSWDSPIMKPNL